MLYVLLCYGQGLFYVVTGLWPLFSPSTFQKVTGPKTDFWLVKTVGLLITVIGVALLLSGKGHDPVPQTYALGAGSALALSWVDIHYVKVGRISRVYLLDALVELPLFGLWMVQILG